MKEKLIENPLLFEKGFFDWYNKYSEKNHGLHGWLNNDIYLDEVELPEELLFTLIQKWLRETHQLHITITSISQESWQYHITKPGEPLGTVVGEDYYTYEEALSKGLYKALKLIK